MFAALVRDEIVIMASAFSNKVGKQNTINRYIGYRFGHYCGNQCVGCAGAGQSARAAGQMRAAIVVVPLFVTRGDGVACERCHMRRVLPPIVVVKYNGLIIVLVDVFPVLSRMQSALERDRGPNI